MFREICCCVVHAVLFYCIPVLLSDETDAVTIHPNGVHDQLFKLAVDDIKATISTVLLARL